MNLSQKCDTWEWRGRNECESSIMSCALPTFPPSANTTSVIGSVCCVSSKLYWSYTVAKSPLAKRSLQEASCTVLGEAVLVVLTILSTHWVLLSHTTCDWQVAVRSETFVYSECYKHPHLLFIMIYNFTQTYQHKRDWAMPELVKHRNADRSRPKELEPAYAHLIIIQLHFLFKHVGNLLRRYFLFFQKN